MGKLVDGEAGVCGWGVGEMKRSVNNDRYQELSAHKRRRAAVLSCYQTMNGNGDPRGMSTGLVANPEHLCRRHFQFSVCLASLSHTHTGTHTDTPVRERECTHLLSPSPPLPPRIRGYYHYTQIYQQRINIKENGNKERKNRDNTQTVVFPLFRLTSQSPSNTIKK